MTAILLELLKRNIAIQRSDIRSEENGKIWSLWVEQKGGLDTSADKFQVDLGELAAGIDYVTAAGYRVWRWAYRVENNNGQGRETAPRPALAPIVAAEDDQDDRLFILKSLQMNQVENPLVTVANGEELLDYLHRRGKFHDGRLADPCVILLDLNMPRMDGREALRIIKSDGRLRRIPVVILTTSHSSEDVFNGYGDGVNSYITKPPTFDGFVSVMRGIRDYWLNTVQLPLGGGALSRD